MVAALSTLLEVDMYQYNWNGVERSGKERSGYVRFRGAELQLIGLCIEVTMEKGILQNSWGICPTSEHSAYCNGKSQ